jgi:UDPglucose 6-dehydrogenase
MVCLARLARQSDFIHGGSNMSLKMTVIGTGYLGAVHAACMADLGFEVLGVDVDPDKLASLSAGKAPFYEPGLEDLLQRAVASGRLRFTSSFAEAAEFGDVHFLCVGTPQKKGGQGADLTYVDSAVTSLAPHLQRPSLLVGKSTVPVGTAARLSSLLAELAPVGAEARLAWNPEFLREGFAVQDTVSPDRLVVGVQDDTSEGILREVYASQIAAGIPFLRTDFATAELVKAAANAFLATKISFINAMAEVCDATGADVTQLAAAIGHDDRIGHKFLRAGLGFGGGCLPKDIRAFMARADELGVGQSLQFLREVDTINIQRRQRAVQIATAMVGTLDGATIAVLGAAFKPDSDDVRDSPALDVAAMLHSSGAKVRLYDPHANANARRLVPVLDYRNSASQACAGADLVMLLTEWQEFRGLDPTELAKIVASPRILDGRNVLDPTSWRAAGWTFSSLGRP